MAQTVDLYDSAYSNFGSDTYRLVRLETYGEDFGQTSWVTNGESKEIPQLIGLRTGSSALEIGCGSGGYAVHLAEQLGCRVTGIDINAAGVRTATELARVRGCSDLLHFEQCDASRELPFKNDTFDAVFSNDVLCHIPQRFRVFCEVLRVLKPGGQMLFSDALVVGGMLSHEEIATRSSIGFYVYSPPGVNERILERAGFCRLRVTDTTENAARIAKGWHEARERRKEELVAAEGRSNFEGLQRFLSCVHSLMNEKRLLRYLYVASKEL